MSLVPPTFWKRERPEPRRFSIFLDAFNATQILAPGPLGVNTGEDFTWTWTVRIPKALKRARLYLDAAHLGVENVGGNGNCGVHISCDGLNVTDSFSSSTGASRHLGFLTVFGANHIQYIRYTDKFLTVTDVPTTFQFTIKLDQSENDVVVLNRAAFELALVEEDYE